MSIRPSNAAIALVVVLAGILLTTLVPQGPFRDLGSAEAANPVTYSYAENGTDPVARFSATDQDGGTVTWGVNGTDAEAFEISTAGVLTFKDAPNFEGATDDGKDNSYNVTVTAASSVTATQEVVVNVTDVDESGTVTLDKPQPQVTRTIKAEEMDPDAPVDDISWQWSRGPNMDGPWTSISGATSASRTPTADDVGNYLRATVTYKDKFGSGKTAFAVSENAVEARTLANAAPSFDDLDMVDGTDGNQIKREVDENLKGASVGKPISATDADGDILVYTLIDPNDGDDIDILDLFEIDARTGQIKTKVAIDSKAGDSPNDADNDEDKYIVGVKAEDPSEASTTQSGASYAEGGIEITINNTNDAPKFTTTGNNAAPTELWVREIEGTGRQLQTRSVANDGTVSYSNLTGTPYAATDDDTDDADKITYAVTGADKDFFKIPAGALTFSGTDATGHKPNFEAKSSYSITLTAADDGGAMSKLAVTVNVRNFEDTGKVGLSQREPQDGRTVVASLSDEDGSVKGIKWQWYRNASTAVDEASDLSGVSAVCGDVTATLCKIDKATSPSYTPKLNDYNSTSGSGKLAVLVTYKDGYPTLTGDPATDAGDSAFAVTEADVQKSAADNTAPKFADDQDTGTPGNQPDAVRSVAENEDKGTDVGDAVTATDSNNNELLLYSLSGTDAASFEIESGLNDSAKAGQITTAMKLDYETKSRYTVVVTATDPSGATDTINVIINVTNGDDKGVVTGASAVNYAENGTDAVASFSATDQDGDAIKWSIGGDDVDDFEISSAGVLTFKASPNYEKPGDMDSDRIHKVTVTANGGDHMVEVTVTDVDESGSVTLNKPQPQVGRNIAAGADDPGDPDEPVTEARWQWSRASSASGPWNVISGATAESRTPTADDVGMYLRAMVTYTDKFGAGKTASAVSENAVEARTVANAAPSFDGQDENDTQSGNQITREVNEGIKGANVGKPVSATDADGDILVYTLIDPEEGGDDILALFEIDARTGQIKTKVDTIDANPEGGDTADTEDTYTVSVMAVDPSDAGTTQTGIEIKIKDTNDAPKFPNNAPKELQVAEKATALMKKDSDGNFTVALDGGDYTATDDDAGDTTRTYAVTGADAGSFTIGTTGQLSFATDHTPNFEAQSSYSITLTVKDDRGAMSKLPVSVTVTNVEDDGSVSLTQREPQVGRTVAANLSDEDGKVKVTKWQWFRNASAATTKSDLEDIVNNTDAVPCAAGATGLCKIDKATSPSYTPGENDAGAENASRLAILVQYTDGLVTSDGNTPPGDAGDSSFAVTQADVQASDSTNTAPKFADDQDTDTPGVQANATRTVDENQPVGTAVGDAVTADPKDGDLLIYSLSGPDAASFTIESGLKTTDTDGQITTAEKFDYESKRQYSVTVTATDPSGASDTVDVVIKINDVDDPPTIIVPGDGGSNSAPTFGVSTATRSVAENTATGTAIGAPVTATDADGDAITYSVSGADSSSFTINASTGQLMTSAALDYETKSSYTVTVAASDGTASATISVTINVTDVSETGFDLNGNGTIERSEVIAAIGSYIGGTGGVQRSDVIGLIGRYISGS